MSDQNRLFGNEQLMGRPREARTQNMESGDGWINDAFDDFNSPPEGCLNYLLDRLMTPLGRYW